MTKSDLILKISNSQKNFTKSDSEEVVNCLLNLIENTLVRKGRIEIRGFGSFSVRQRPSRLARNPKTGTSIAVESKFYSYFRPSKHLKQELNC